MNECIYCGATESDQEGEEVEITTYSAGDESIDVCEACRENIID